MPEILMAIDTETTGLEPWTGHQLLDIAAYPVAPAYPYDLLDDVGFRAVIRHDPEHVYGLANDYVRKMHEKTGLWDQVADGQPADEVDEALLAYMQRFTDEPRQARSVGNSIRLDLNFIELGVETRSFRAGRKRPYISARIVALPA